MLDRLIGFICRLFSLLMVLCMAAMVLMVFGNVVLRYGFNSGITVSEELSRWFFVWMTFLGAFVAMHTRQHLGTDVVIGRLPPLGRKLCFVASRVLMLFVCCLVVMGGWTQTLLNRDATSPVTQAPVALLYFSGMVFGALAAVVLLNDLWCVFRGRGLVGEAGGGGA